jgi:tryptophan synthase alpha chain
MTCDQNAYVVLQDPLADGPVIQSASTRALDNGTTLDGVLGMLSGVAGRLSAPVVMFTYYNPIMARGPDVFCQQARDAGASGGLCLCIRVRRCSGWNRMRRVA